MVMKTLAPALVLGFLLGCSVLWLIITRRSGLIDEGVRERQLAKRVAALGLVNPVFFSIFVFMLSLVQAGIPDYYLVSPAIKAVHNVDDIVGGLWTASGITFCVVALVSIKRCGPAGILWKVLLGISPYACLVSISIYSQMDWLRATLCATWIGFHILG
jgi:hypothetical protein